MVPPLLYVVLTTVNRISPGTISFKERHSVTQLGFLSHLAAASHMFVHRSTARYLQTRSWATIHVFKSISYHTCRGMSPPMAYTKEVHWQSMPLLTSMSGIPPLPTLVRRRSLPFQSLNTSRAFGCKGLLEVVPAQTRASSGPARAGTTLMGV